MYYQYLDGSLEAEDSGLWLDESLLLLLTLLEFWNGAILTY